MASDATIPIKHLERLRDEYRRDSDQLQRQANSLQGSERRFCENRSSITYAHAQDLDDLIQGREHPSGRRR